MSILQVILAYIMAVIQDGDYLNDWLTHLVDPGLRMIVQFLGILLAGLLHS